MVRSKRLREVYCAILQSGGIQPASAAAHAEVAGIDIWTPIDDVTVIGARLAAGWNGLPATKMTADQYVYIYADLSTMARRGETNAQIIEVNQAQDFFEGPAAGVYYIYGLRQEVEAVMFPEDEGIDLDRLHSVYLNVGYRAEFAAGGVEVHAVGYVYYTLR